ncbi:unnamed protein product [Didymodactylos carnosus]|uniref:Uncharacterized protein n=1 Tax=Didymodactylos carnosus TaxID=1234261 RepID=A0A815IA70_9BILA|nr:unnamed protein product [Didymodactylos carnosus]CAF4242709.1 unnamed protein product [Didymodactylos carnosus]
MIYGREPKLPFDHQHPLVSIQQDPDHLNKLSSYLTSMVKEAQKNILEQQQKSKNRYDRNRSDPQYRIGDLVLIKKINARNKFDIRNEGPFRIIEKLAQKTYVVQHVKNLDIKRQVISDVIVPLFERPRLTSKTKDDQRSVKLKKCIHDNVNKWNHFIVIHIKIHLELLLFYYYN